MEKIRPIQTEYKGYLFRSRLEARWAVFFDACGVDWEYEPEGYDLGNGIHYLPDFLLRNVQLGGFGSGSDISDICSLYVEVKGQMTLADSEKLHRVLQDLPHEPVRRHVHPGGVHCKGEHPGREPGGECHGADGGHHRGV